MKNTKWQQYVQKADCKEKTMEENTLQSCFLFESTYWYIYTKFMTNLEDTF